MRYLIQDIRSSLEAGIYSTSLAATLMLPDACGKIDYPSDGVGQRYQRWYDANVDHPMNLMGFFSCAVAYQLRCGLTHEVRLAGVAKGFETVAFSLPADRVNRLHFTMLAKAGRKALVIDLRYFCLEVIHGVEKWLALSEQDPLKAAELAGLVGNRDYVLDPFFGEIDGIT